MKFSFRIRNTKTLAVIAFIIILLLNTAIFAQNATKQFDESISKTEAVITENSIKSDAKITTKSGDYVILIHGIARHKYSMYDYKMAFEKLGYDTYIVDYAGKKYPVSKIYNIVNEQIQKIIIDKNKKVHFVGSSLGAILVRMIIEFNPPKNLGRIVQITPPNQGSAFAENIKGSQLANDFWGPAIHQLVSGKYSIYQQLSNSVNYELGIIAGNKPIKESWVFRIEGDNDGVLSIDNTIMEGMTEHYIINDDHEHIIDNKETLEKTVKFITEGTFYGF